MASSSSNFFNILEADSDDEIFNVPLSQHQPREILEYNDDDELDDDRPSGDKRPRSSPSMFEQPINASEMTDDRTVARQQVQPIFTDSEADELIYTVHSDTAKSIFNDRIAVALRKVLGKSCASEWNPKGVKYVAIPMDLANPNVTFDKIARLPADTFPVLDRFCLPLFFKACTHSGNTKFGGFKKSTDQGIQDCLSFWFYMMAFTNPKFGTNTPERERSDEYIFSYQNVRRSFPKVSVHIEPLVRVPDRENVIKMFAVENVVGFRVWFYIHDPNINPIQVIEETIADIRRSKGVCNGYQRVSRHDPEFAERIEALGENLRGVKLVLAEIERINQRLARAENEMKNNAMRYKERAALKDNSPSFFLTTVHSVYIFFTMIQCRRMECNMCYRSVMEKCEMCRNKDMITENLSPEDEQEDAEMERRYTRISVANHRASAMNMPCALEIDYELIEKALNPRRALWPYFDRIDDRENPQWKYCNTNMQDMLEIAGVCAEQRDELNYNHIDRNGQLYYSFFTQHLVFKMASSVCHDIDNLANMEYPWIFSAANLMLDVLEEALKDTMLRKQIEHTKRHCTPSVVATKVYQDAVAISNAYAEMSQSDPIEEYYFKPVSLTDNSFAGITLAQHNGGCVDRAVVVVESTDAATEYHMKMRRQLIRLDNIKGSISKVLSDIVIEQIRNEGFVCLGNIFHSSNDQLTNVERNAAKMIEDAADMGALSTFHEILTIDPALGAYGSMLVSMMYYFDSCVDRIYDGHIIALQMYFCMMRALHSHELEELIKAPTSIQNIVNQGTESVGKTERILMLIAILVIGMAQPITSQSDRSQSVASNFSGTTMIYDELDSTTCPIKASQSGKMNNISMAKQEATNFYIVHATLSLADGKFSADGYGTRRQTKYISRAHRARIILANDFYYLVTEASYWSRFTVYYSLARQERLQLRVASGNQLKLTPSTIKNVSPSGLTSRQNWYSLSSSIHAYAAVAMKMGVIPYPNMQMLGIYYNRLAEHMSVYFPTFVGNSRIVGHVYAQCISKLIHFAIQMAFTSEISPLLGHSNEEGITPLSFTHDKIKWISPWLFLPEDSVIFELTHMVLYNQLRTQEYELALQLATLFCNFSTKEDTRCFYATRLGPNSTQLEDYNYVSTKMNFTQIARHMIHNYGYNGATVNEMLNSLSRLTFVADDYIDYTVPDRSVRCRRTIPVVEFVIAPNAEITKNNTGVLAPDLINPSAKINISIEYLSRWSPAKVVEYMMQAFRHRDTRPRKVLIGHTMPGYPEMLATYNLTPDPTKVLTIKEVAVANRNIMATISPDCGIMQKTQEANLIRQKESSPIIETNDLERTLCVRWLQDETTYIPPKIIERFGYEMYVPEGYNKMIMERRVTNPVYKYCHDKGFSYPETQIGKPLSEIKQYVDEKHLLHLVNARPVLASRDPKAPSNIEAERTNELINEGKAQRAQTNGAIAKPAGLLSGSNPIYL